MAVPGFLVPSGFSVLPGSGHTTTIGATGPPPHQVRFHQALSFSAHC